MKLIHHINIIAFIINIGLYIYEPMLGLLAQIGLGLLQIILAIRITLEKHKFNSIIQNHIVGYWLSILIWLLTTSIIYIFTNSNLVIRTSLIIFPMSIAFYFVVITYLTQKK